MEEYQGFLKLHVQLGGGGGGGGGGGRVPMWGKMGLSSKEEIFFEAEK